MAELSALTKLKVLDLSGNEFSGLMDLQGKFSQIIPSLIKICGERNFNK